MAKGKVTSGPITEMEIVERPMSTKHVWPVTKEVAAIAGTVESGKAVQLAFRTAAEMKNIQMALRHQVAKMGLKMRYAKAAGDRIVAWAEKVGEAGK
jgi:hypothetical protein